MSDAGEQEEIPPAEVGGGEALQQEEEDPSLEQDPLDALQLILQNIVAEANAGNPNPSLSARVACIDYHRKLVILSPLAKSSITKLISSLFRCRKSYHQEVYEPKHSRVPRTVDLPNKLIGLEANILPKSWRGLEGSKQGSIN